MDIEELFTKIAGAQDFTREELPEGQDRIEFIQPTPRNVSTASFSLAFGALQILGRLCLGLFGDQGTP